MILRERKAEVFVHDVFRRFSLLVRGAACTTTRVSQICTCERAISYNLIVNRWRKTRYRLVFFSASRFVKSRYQVLDCFSQRFANRVSVLMLYERSELHNRIHESERQTSASERAS